MQFFPRKLLFALGLTGLLLLTTAACGGRNPGYQQSVPNHPTVSTSTPYHAISAPATPSPTPYPISTATPAPIPTSPKNVWFQTSCKDTSIEATIKPGQSVNIEYKTGNRAGKISIGVEQIVSQASRNTATFILSGQVANVEHDENRKVLYLTLENDYQRHAIFYDIFPGYVTFSICSGGLAISDATQ